MKLILFPLKLELNAFLEKISKQFEFIASNVGKLQVYNCAELNWTLAIGGHGKVQFAIQSQYLLSQLSKKPQLLICCGVAGSLVTKVKCLDVVIATKTIEHDYNLKFVKRPLPEFVGHEQSIAVLKAMKFENFQLHANIIASGDEDIVDSIRALELHQKTGGYAVAWEGVGGAKTAKFNGIDFLEIRAITDEADKNALLDFETNLKQSMVNAAEVLLKI